MKCMRIISVILSLVFLFCLSSCKAEENIETTTVTFVEETESVTSGESVYPAETELQTEAETLPPVVTEAPSEAQTQEKPSEAVETTEELTEETENADAYGDVSSWTAEKIADFYKSAATKTGSSVKSEQTIALSDISVNNGELGGVFKYVTPILSKFLSGNATVTDGITGEYELLTASDMASSSARKTEKGIVVEFSLNPQTDNAANGTQDGSVAHAINIVADLMGVMKQLNGAGLPIEITEEKTVISYTNPSVKVLIDDNGEIINGTWSCDVVISMSDYTFAGAKVESTEVSLKNTITVNGGYLG